LWQDYRDRNVQVLVIDVMETEEATRVYAERSKFTFPVLLDSEGKVAASYAPEGVLPDLPRDQVPIASNLIIDPQGEIQFYTLLDSVNFDAKLVQLKARLEELLANGGS
jgi:peroxiredoxin